MNEIQYLTQTLFGQPYNGLEDLTDEQQGQVIVLRDLANAYMATKNISFQEAVQLAHENLPEDYVDNTELGFQLEMAQKSGDPMDIINTVRNYVSYNKIIYG